VSWALFLLRLKPRQWLELLVRLLGRVSGNLFLPLLIRLDQALNTLGILFREVVLLATILGEVEELGGIVAPLLEHQLPVAAARGGKRPAPAVPENGSGFA